MIEPYKRYPDLLGVLLKGLQVEQVPDIRLELLTVLGVLGAIDPDFEFEQLRAMKNPHLYCLLCAGDVPVLFEDLD